ncbi:Ig-like domain-containing protein [Rhodohalobacter sulfatireducens]|uniref:Ig-like domain-containing protein n=1 Tax=Rhodohalobacter sulfatireducens TaxID=2911366 RepID=A0ABS9KEL6_9BACT|nr:Ig-like domain-containing protein [Rhodohalobacter sulfatireducens]MCG2589303.1 Ig-like domain-containing protein [Rhodohalobacter sulfatireducens]
MIYSKTQFFKTTGFSVIIILIAGMLNIGCEDNNPAEPEEDELEGAEVVIEPQNVSMEVDEKVDFSAFVVSASGDTVNEEFNFQWNWYSSNPEVFTVQNNGTATGKSSGEAFCIVEASTGNSKIVAKMVPIGLDSARVFLF